MGKLAPALTATIEFLRANWPAIGEGDQGSPRVSATIRSALNVAFGSARSSARVAGFIREHSATVGAARPIIAADIVLYKTWDIVTAAHRPRLRQDQGRRGGRL